MIKKLFTETWRTQSRIKTILSLRSPRLGGIILLSEPYFSFFFAGAFFAAAGLAAAGFAPEGWFLNTACAAARRATGTRNGEQET